MIQIFNRFMNPVKTRRSHYLKNLKEQAMKPALPAPANAGRRNHWRAIPTCAVALGCILASASPAGAGTDGSSHMKGGAAAYTQSYAPEHGREQWRGESRAALTQRWWRWWMSIPKGVNPSDQAGDANCEINQQGPVWFLGGPLGSSFTRSCTIPAGKAILSPIVTFINDYPCPDLTFQPTPGQSLDDFLRIGVAPILDGVTLAEAQLDGTPLKVRRVVTKLFSFTGAASLVPNDSCITGSPQLGVSDGFFVFIEPLDPGEHILQIRSVSPFTGTSQGTYNLKIHGRGQ